MAHLLCGSRRRAGLLSIAVHALALGWLSRSELPPLAPPPGGPGAGGGGGAQLTLVRVASAAQGVPTGLLRSAAPPAPVADPILVELVPAPAATVPPPPRLPTIEPLPAPAPLLETPEVAAVAQPPEPPRSARPRRRPKPAAKRAAEPQAAATAPALTPAVAPAIAPAPQVPVLGVDAPALQPGSASDVPNVAAPGMGAGTPGAPGMGGAASGPGSGFLQDAQPLYQPDPTYPRSALAAGREGKVVVGFTIRRDGTTHEIHIIAAEPPQVFDNAALRAVASWRYEPPVLNGEIVERPNMQVTIDFKIKGRRAPMQRF